MLTANLHADSISVTAGAIVGQQTTLTAKFRSTDLVAGTRFTLKLLVDSQELLTKAFSAREGVDQLYAASIAWFARPGKLELRVDADNAIAEANESDNVTTLAYTPAPLNLSEKFIFPVGGTVLRDWFILTYADAEPNVGQQADFRGGPFQYDGHPGTDILLAHQFSEMDQGVPVYAAAAGTVLDVEGGQYNDRITSGAFETERNAIYIDHGAAIKGYYVHFAADTITVKAGDRVRAGQLLGYVGSSGPSLGPHLHLGVGRGDDQRLIEPHSAPDLYWVNPPAYSGELAVTVLDGGIANYPISTRLLEEPQPSESKEGPSTINIFPVSSTWDVHYWAWIIPLQKDDLIEIRWLRPDGSEELTQAQTYVETEHSRLNFQSPYVIDSWSLAHDRWSQHSGIWHVATLVNGREIDRKPFEVTTGPGVPEMRVTQGSTYIIDGRTTPIDFGTVSVTGTGVKRTFTIQNHGSVDLTTGDLELPPGFSLVGDFPAQVAPGSTASFVLQLNASPPGPQFGEVRFHTNDADETEFEFNVKGNVSGSQPAGTPILRISGQPAQVYINSGTPAVIAPTASVVDTDSTAFNGGSLTVELASGAQADDRLTIRHQGTGTGQIGLHENTVTYQGTTIGTWSGGVGRTPLVIHLNADATKPAVQSLLRNVTFSNVSLEPATRHRYVRFTLVDDTGKTSNLPIAHVVIDPRLGGPNPTGDVNGDHVVNAADLDLIAAQIASGKFDTKFNFVADDVIDDRDLDFIVNNVLHTTRGDLDLDGDVDSADLAALLAGWTGVQQPQTGRASWSTGDMDGDGDTDSADLLELLGQWTGAAASSRQLVQDIVE